MLGTDTHNQVIKTLRQLALPSDQYAVFGSGLLDVLGIRKSNDIDLIVTENLFRELSVCGEWRKMLCPDGFPGLKHRTENIDLFYESKMPLCSKAEIQEKIRRATMIDGVTFVQLGDILAWKRALGREKDIGDVKKIETYMNEKDKEKAQ